MDINLNNQNDKDERILEKDSRKSFFQSFLFTALILLALAALSVSLYLPIRNAYFPMEDNVRNYLQSSSFSYDLYSLTEYLQRSMRGPNEDYYSIFQDVESIKYKIQDRTPAQAPDQGPASTLEEAGLEGSRGETREAEGEVPGAGRGSFREIPVLTNMPGISEEEFQEEIDNSLFYIKVTFDEKGYPTIGVGTGEALQEDRGEPDQERAEEGKRSNRDSSKREKIAFHKDIFTIQFNNLDSGERNQYANLEVTYIIPQDFEDYEDIFTARMKETFAFSQYGLLILIIGAVSILILTIGAFAVPYKIQKDMAICKAFNRMFLEVKFVVWGLYVALIFLTLDTIDYNYGYYRYGLSSFIYNADPLFYLLGISLTFLLYLLIYLGIVYTKYIFYSGFKKGVISNSIFGRMILKIFRTIKNIIKAVITIDLRKDNYRKIVGLTVINFLAIVTLGTSGFLGFVLAIGYSLLIFKYLLRVLDRVKALNEASRLVAEGNFDINLYEDMGILSPIAENLNNINRGFSLAVEREIKSQRMKSELISNVSHDLKTPLTSIITYVDLLKNEDLDLDTQKEYIHILDRKSQRLKVLIEDLFEASKATSGNIDLNLETIDVAALFRQTLGELEEKMEESNLQFRINMPEHKVMCNLDGRRTFRVFENIMTNILKYSMENSRVYIDVIEGENQVEFIFKNISAYEMNFDPSEITERFTRGDKSRNTEGSGLGLSIAKSFVELQNGSLEIFIDGDLFKLIVTFPKAA